MTTNRFQPGDKVRVKSRTLHPVDLGLAPNTTYTVSHVDDFGKVSLRGDARYFHPSHFELVMRAVVSDILGRYGRDTDMPCYSLKDGEGDWWVYETDDPAAEGAWHLLGAGGIYRTGTDEGVQAIADQYGIDGTPTAPAEPETYCLKDKDDDWWHSADGENFRLWSWSDRATATRTLDHIIDLHGIDAEPIPAVAEGPLRAGPGQIFYAPLVDAEPEVDQRISAWDKIADHPIFKDCYPEERPLIDAMMAKLDRIYSEGASPAASTGNSTGPHLQFEAKTFAPGDRVEYVGGGEIQTPGLVGKIGTVSSIGDEPDDINVEWDDRNAERHGVLAENLRMIYPAPLQPGDWVKVLARVEQVFDNGSTRTQTFQSNGAPNGPRGFAIASAITRTDEVPEWAKEPARCTSLHYDAPRDALVRCEADASPRHGSTHVSQYGRWTDNAEYGRVEVTER